jgi:carotenoid 1,2-hydratase
MQALSPAFDQPVPPGGYAWWYVDALSDDGRHGLTLIAFVGSVFSPYYAWARQSAARHDRRADARTTPDPTNHCALNVALYGDCRRWAMTERSAGQVSRSPRQLVIGPSQLQWNGNELVIGVDEITVPVPSRLQGQVCVHPEALFATAYPMDPAGRHRWCPIAPCARIEVDFNQPKLKWSGTAYLDNNLGDRPLEDDFIRWDWSRARAPGGQTTVLYDVTRRNADPFSLSLAFDPSGHVSAFEPPPLAALPASRWRIPRGTRSDAGAPPRIKASLEDGPFYARSLLETRLRGMTVPAVHESLDLDRFRSRWVQAMLPFRMPRRTT